MSCIVLWCAVWCAPTMTLCVSGMPGQEMGATARTSDTVCSDCDSVCVRYAGSGGGRHGRHQ